MIKNSEKGVSLIIAFFVMITIIAVVVSLSILSYGQIKILGNISNAVTAFYLADSGVEKVLYYDRKVIPDGADRGMCDICTSCGEDCEDCTATPITENGCDLTTCTNCNVKFTTGESSEYYNMDIIVNQQCKVSSGSMNAYGSYQSSSRAIMVSLNTKATIGVPPTISCPEDDPANCDGFECSDGSGDPLVTFNAVTSADAKEVWAYVTGLGAENNINQCGSLGWIGEECVYREIELVHLGGGTWQAQWNQGISGVRYRVSMVTYDEDDEGNCVQIEANDIYCP